MVKQAPLPASCDPTHGIAELQDLVRRLQETVDALSGRQIIPTADGLIAVRHRLGWLFLPQEDYASLTHLADGVSGHENGTLSLIGRIVAQGDTVIDIGAHIGLITLPMAHMVGPGGQVIAIEPLPRTAECLMRALVSNHLSDRCEIVVAAATDQDGTVDFYLGANSMLGSLVPSVDDQKSIVVNEICLDNRVAADTAISFIKMDVEGAELTTLQGLRRIIAQNDELMLVAEFGPSHLERVGIEVDDWFAAFEQAGFNRRFVIDEPSGALGEADPAVIRNVFSANILFAKDGPRLERLLANG